MVPEEELTEFFEVLHKHVELSSEELTTLLEDNYE
jgi:hypothetical protein